MADADVPITAGTGTKVDTRTVGAGTDEHRQVVVIGDPSTASEVALVNTGRLETRDVNVAAQQITIGTSTYTEGSDSAGRTIAAVRRDADTTLVSATNEYAPLQVDARGNLKVEVFSGGEDIPVTATLAAGTATNEVVGDVAHSIAAAGNPVLNAGISQNNDDTAPPNRVDAESDATRLATDWDGSLYVRPHGPQVWKYHSNGSSALTDASVHAAPGSGLSLYIGTIVFSSGAATAINLFLEEGSTTIAGPYYLEAVAGRGMSVQFNPPLKVTANTALTVTTSAAIAHSVDITGFTAQG